MGKTFLLLLLLALIIAGNVAYYLLRPELSGQEPDLPAAAAKTAPAVVPPPLEALGQGARLPTPEELEEEARYDEAQVRQAGDWLHSPQASKRVTGAEQLSAYPTPEAERLLTEALALDFDPEVRKAAAQSLSTFKQPSAKAVDALLAALEDDDEGVQMGALNALLGIVDKMENGSARLKKTLAAMAKKAASRRTGALAKQALRAFLQDRQPPPRPLGAKN